MVIYGEKRKVVIFNLDHPEERELYELASAVNFGPLVKRYLLQELHRRKVPVDVGPSSIQLRTEG